MSFKFKVSDKERATGRFKGRAHRAIVRAVREAKESRGLTQSDIAESMGVDKSVVSRILNGKGNLTLQTIGEISWVLGLRPDLVFSNAAPKDFPGNNHYQQDLRVDRPGSSGASFFQTSEFAANQPVQLPMDGQ
ncbi:helix-turn-helix transcriptional regulator [Roseobacter sp. SK209-2-6]|uniref:helix-turn-helix transcriptional regulator n=1 Tax=Roseobacter sp. SK209-2-6 TaxID=388739 RepID=UPI0012F50EA3|nr:helix-turn-helix transcriptional regulator [Roseobacter sp. SK209-2-6]